MFSSASLHSGLVGCVSRRSWEDTDTHQAGCKNLLSDFRIGKVCGYHKKPGILSLFWPTVDWGVLSCLFLSPPFWKPVSLSADISISDQAWQKLARRTAALCSMELYLHLCGLTICPQARLASTSPLLCSKVYQTKIGRSLQGELQPFLLSMELYLHLRGLTKSIDTTPDCQNCEDWSRLVKQSWWLNGAEVGGGCLGFRGVAVKWIRCNLCIESIWGLHEKFGYNWHFASLSSSQCPPCPGGSNALTQVLRVLNIGTASSPIVSPLFTWYVLLHC